MTDATDIKAMKINTYSVNSNDAWPQCADDDRTGSYVKWGDVVKLLSDQCKGSEHETGFDSLKNLKFVADCCIENPDSIYASEFFLLLDEMFGKQGDYSMPVQAVAVSHLLRLLEAERQRADAAETGLWGRSCARETQRANKAEAELAALKGEQVPVAYVCTSFLDAKEDFTISKRLPVGTPLYDRPQKPVVLPDNKLFTRSAVVAAIEAAGGIVKDGE